jgi:CRP/FNR family transcriptional regulator, cyclic AMP receptor protein
MMLQSHQLSAGGGLDMSAIQSSDELYELLARAGDTRRLSAGEVIFERGENGTCMYIVRAGTVALKLGDEVLETVTAPGLFGEMALIDYEPRALTAVAQSDIDVVEIPERRFWILVHETPRFAQLVMRVMADRLRRVSGTG